MNTTLQARLVHSTPGLSNTGFTMKHFVLLVSLFGVLGSAFAAAPSLTAITPAGAQRGHDHEITFRGARLGDAAEVMFYEPGISASDIKTVNEKSFTAKVKIEPDCRVGVVHLRVRTRSGVSELRQFFVGDLPAIKEKGPNDSIVEAQKVPLNSTLEGVTRNEDIDYFKFQAKKGQRVTAEVEGTRLSRVRFYDPRIAILDRKRFELAASDDTPLLRQDGMCSVIIPEDGTYFVTIRDSAYLGGNAPYRIHLGTFPRPTAVFPLGGKSGEKLKIATLGLLDGPFEQEVTFTPEIEGYMRFTAVQNGQSAPSPNLLRVCDYRNVIESGTNTSKKTSDNAGIPPFAFNGILTDSKTYDWFHFTGKKGVKYHIKVYARTLRTPVDPVIAIYKRSGGRALRSNDDTGGPDSYMRFDCPADGEYDVYIRDHLRNAGPDYAYRVEVEPVKPKLRTNLPTFTQRTQENNAIAIPRGNKMTLRLDARRNDFGGDLKFIAQNLPPGVKMWAPPMPSDMTQGPLIFEAAADAPLGGSLAKINAEKTDGSVKGHYLQNVVLLYGRNNNVWMQTFTDKMPVVVTEEAPFTLELVQPKAPLVHGGTMHLQIKAHRKEGFDGAIKCRLSYKPPGVGAASEISIAKGKNEGRLRVNANGSSGDRVWPITVLGWADVKGKLWVGSNKIDLKTEPPFVTGKIPLVTVERAKETEVVVKLNQNKPFEGEGTVYLSGLPNEVTTEKQTFTKDTKELVFPVKTTGKSPVGHHKSLFASLRIPFQGETMISSTAGGGQLRIDPPPKKPKPKPAVAGKPKPKVAKPKVLSRLEKLRIAKEEAKR